MAPRKVKTTIKTIPDEEKPEEITLERTESGYSLDGVFGESFNTAKIRSKFVRKVYFLLTLQLGFTCLCIVPSLAFDDVQEFVVDYPWIIWVSLGVFIVPYFMLVCCESTRRSFPTNLILLFLMTLGMACACAGITARLDTKVVFYAFVLTVLVTLVISLLAICCPFDFTSCHMLMCVILVVLTVFLFLSAFLIIFTNNKILHMVYAGIAVVIFSLFLMFDTQAIMGGRRVQLSPDEYILATIQLYVDIVEIFLNFLELIGACTESD